MASNLPWCRSRCTVNISHWIKMKTTDGGPTFISFWLLTEDAVCPVASSSHCHGFSAVMDYTLGMCRLCQWSCPGTENNNRYRFSPAVVFANSLLLSTAEQYSILWFYSLFHYYILVDIWKTFRFKYLAVDIEVNLRWRKRIEHLLSAYENM